MYTSLTQQRFPDELNFARGYYNFIIIIIIIIIIKTCYSCSVLVGTDTTKFAGYKACECLKNFYRTDRFGPCQPCPKQGLTCAKDYAELQTGYWWQWDSNESKEQYANFILNMRIKNDSFNHNSSVYNRSMPKAYACPRGKSCLGGLESRCSVGYSGPLCDVCAAGHYRRLQSCKECPSRKWLAIQVSLTVAIVVVIVALVVWTSKRKSKEKRNRPLVDIILARLKIIVGFYQVVYGLLDAFAYIKWPRSLSLVAKYSELLQLNVFQIAPLPCIDSSLKMDAFGNMLAMMSLNIGLMVIAFLLYSLRKLQVSRNTLLRSQEKSKALSYAKELVYRNLFFFLYVTYLSTCSRVSHVLPLACRKLCQDKDEQRCSSFLKSDYNVKCEGQRYRRLLIVAYSSIAYVVGLPAIACLILRKYKQTLKRDDTSGECNRSEAVTGLRFLFENYRSDCWYWELVEMIRKLILTSGLILIGGESRAYVGLACVVSGLFGIAFAHKTPISDPFENKLQLTALAVTFVNLGIGAISKIPKENIPTDIDPYVDSVLFDVMVFCANALVMGMLAGNLVNCILCRVKCAFTWALA